MEHVSSVRPTGKFPEKVENLKRWSRFPGWNFRTECRVPFTFLVLSTSSRSAVGHRHVAGFTTKWNNFLPIGNSFFATTEISGFFPKWKAPGKYPCTQISCRRNRQEICVRDNRASRRASLAFARLKNACSNSWKKKTSDLCLLFRLLQRFRSRNFLIQGLVWDMNRSIPWHAIFPLKHVSFIIQSNLR